MRSDTVISVKNVSKSYETYAGRRIDAIKDISFELREKEVLSLVGPSGCGKSTLLRIIAKFDAPSQGKVERLKQDLILGFIFQDSSLMKWRKVYDNIKLPLEVLKSNERDRVTKVIELVNLSGFESVYPSELSGGMQRRVAIARAIVHQPNVLIMDEPFTGVDEITKEVLHAELHHLIRTLDITGVLVTHNIEEAVYLSDRVLVMSPAPGTVIQEVRVPLSKIREPTIRTQKEFLDCCTVIRERLNLLHPLRTRRETEGPSLKE